MTRPRTSVSRIFAIILVCLQLTVSLIMVGWVLASSGLLREPLIIVALGLVLMTALATVVRIWLRTKTRSSDRLTEENL